MDIYLVRHGESMANANLTSELDSALTPLGGWQARQTAARLRSEGLTRIYVSPLRRTLQTASPICEATVLPAALYADICEYFSNRHPEYQEFSGLSLDEIRSEFSFVTLTDDFSCGEQWWPRSLENHQTVYERAVRVRNSLLERFGTTDEKILIVSHAETVGRLIEAFLRVPPNPDGPPWSENCAISRLHCSPNSDSPAELVYVNNTHHFSVDNTYYLAGPDEC